MLIPNSSVRLKVYGENNSTDILTLYLDLCESSEDFTFKSGNTGTVCINKKERPYFQTSNKLLLNVYVSNVELLSDEQNADLDVMCKSLRFIEKSTDLAN